MNRESLHNSVEVLKILYMVVAGLALAVGLERFVLDEMRQFKIEWISLQTLLFIIFVTTVARFVHGAMRHFDRTYTEQLQRVNWRISQPLVDFSALGIEAFIFFILAYSIADESRFINYYLLLLVVDSIWLFLVFPSGEQPFWSGNTKWWTLANLLVLVSTGGPIVVFFIRGIEIYPSWLLWVFVIGVAFHAVMDYPLNWNLYFGRRFRWPWSDWPKEEAPGARDATASSVPDDEIGTVFIAGPYLGSDFNETEKNIRLAEQYSIELWNRGYKVFCPHLNTSHFEVKAKADEQAYKEFDLRMLQCCDAVFALPKWEDSEGAKAEIEEAKRLEMPVFHSLDALPGTRS